MKKATLGIDQDVLARVRRYAAQRGSSVDALVNEYLKMLSAKEHRAQSARKRLRELSRRSHARLVVWLLDSRRSARTLKV